VSIAEKLAELRAANAKPETEPEIIYKDEDFYNRGQPWYIHKEVFKANLELHGRADIDFLLTRPCDEWLEILKRVEQDNNCVMRFLNDN
jgi:hypothetical protein